MIHDGPNEIELELTPRLQNEGIVNRFVFYRKTSSIQVLLNHQYESKSVIASIHIKDWNNVHETFEKVLKRKGIKQQHIVLLSDVLDDNYHVILSQGEKDEHKEDEEQKETKSEIALRLAREQSSTIFIDQFGMPYAAIQVGDHIETVPMKNSRFRNWLCRIFYKSEGKILTSENVTNVIALLKASAEFDSSEEDANSLNLRVGSRPDEPYAIYYDLTNKDWEYVKITPKDQVITQASKITPIMFKRHPSQRPQVHPAKDYPADTFDRFMKLVNVKGEENQLLLKCYIISLFYPNIPKPVLMLYGEQGAAKSTIQELIKMLVDPSSVKTLTFPRDINALVQKLSHNYIAYFDNVSSIHEWISDELCRAVTGSGFSKRELYTDDDDIIYNFKRCIGFNGINLGAAKPDLLDRGIIVELEHIVKIRKVEDIWAEFEPIKPQLLGYIFDILKEVLKVKSDGGVELQTLPRMADFAEIGEIISRCMGNPKDAFINAYYRNIELQTEEAIAANLLGNAMGQFVQNKPEWMGTATQLHMELEAKAAVLNINIHDKSWPKSANSLSRKLNLIKTNLREIGIEVDRCYLDEDKKSRGFKVKVRKIPSEPSEPTETQEQNQAQVGVTSDISDDTRRYITYHTRSREEGTRCFKQQSYRGLLLSMLLLR